MDSKVPPREKPIRDVAVNRKTIRLGKRFAGSIASRLDNHAGSADVRRVEEERRIILLARKTLSKKGELDSWDLNFLTQAVEMHTKVHGFSKLIYEELFLLDAARTKAQNESDSPARPKGTSTKPSGDLSRCLVGTERKREKLNLAPTKVPRLLKA